jgi:DNA-binding sugar fermentation-stimulating protein
MQKNIHASSGIRTHDPYVRAGEDSSCFRPRGHCDRRYSQWYTDNNVNGVYHDQFEYTDDRFKIQNVSLLHATSYRMVLNIQKQKG